MEETMNEVEELRWRVQRLERRMRIHGHALHGFVTFCLLVWLLFVHGY
jgi:hypothetical protein